MAKTEQIYWLRHSKAKFITKVHRNRIKAIGQPSISNQIYQKNPVSGNKALHVQIILLDLKSRHLH